MTVLVYKMVFNKNGRYDSDNLKKNLNFCYGSESFKNQTITSAMTVDVYKRFSTVSL